MRKMACVKYAFEELPGPENCYLILEEFIPKKMFYFAALRVELTVWLVQVEFESKSHQ